MQRKDHGPEIQTVNNMEKDKIQLQILLQNICHRLLAICEVLYWAWEKRNV